ncbi:hypothetical protein [Kineococcus sp. NPDC059986]|uniref:hypothetical protein n=1 Tax=Kineococcus sp. NPDC059986 TaxID=3155538 RepID=UPI00344C4A63
MADRRLPDGWAAWPLLLTSATSLAATGHAAWSVLGGSADGIVQEVPPPAGPELLGNRWSTLWSGPSVPILLATTLLPLLVLAAAVVAERPRAVAPRGTARSVTNGLAALTTAAAAAGVLGFLAQVVGVLPVTGWSGVTGSEVDAFSVGAVTVLTTAVLGAVVTGVVAGVARPAEPEPEPAPAAPSHPGAEDPGLSDPAPPELDVPAPEPVRPEAVPSEPVEPRPTEPRSTPYPRLAPGDVDLYRRR